MDDYIRLTFEHIETVRRYCFILADRLEKYDKILAESIIANSIVHDSSKFWGIEREHLNTNSKRDFPDKFVEAVKHHHYLNPHHPEHYEGGIIVMPANYLAEMVCDVHTRSTELGDSTKEYFEKIAPIRYGYAENCKVAEQLDFFVKLLFRGFA